MSYFSNNKLFHYYELIENNIESDYIIKNDVIEILNNEEIRFDFSKLYVYAPIHGVLNSTDVETIKIVIDWGDGSIDRLKKPLVSNRSSIGTYRPNSWKVVEHLFNVEKRYEYKTDDIKYLHKITITAYNTFNDKLVVVIPYKMLYKTIYDLGSEMSLFSANTTNTNEVSYTLKQISTDSMFVANTLDWRVIYGNDENVIIQETVAEVFADEFVNEDIMTWDWKTPPVANITCEVDSFKKTIKCSFTEGDIPIDEWYPQMKFLQDSGNVTIYTRKRGVNYYEYDAIMSTEYCKSEIPNNPYDFPYGYDYPKGIYQTYLNPFIGINGVNTCSDSCYFSYPDALPRPKELICQNGKIETDFGNISEPVDLITFTDTDINFNYTLPKWAQVVSLTKGQLTFNGFYNKVIETTGVNENGESVTTTTEIEVPIDDIQFVYDFISPLKDEYGVPLYVNEPITETSKNFTYTVKKRNIPNQIDVDVVYTDESGKDVIKTEKKYIYYKASIATNDVLGGEDNTNISIEKISINDNGEEVKTKKDLIDYKISFDDYTIGDFVEESLSISKVDQMTKTFTVTWEFDKKDDWDQFICSLGKDKEYILTDIHNYQNDGSFEDLDMIKVEDKDDVYKFTKTFNINEIDDGKLDVQVSYRVNMSDFYDYRERTINSEIDLIYPTPKLTINDIQPYFSIIYNKENETQSIRLNAVIYGDSNEEDLKDIALQINSNSVILTEMEYRHQNIGFEAKNIIYGFEAANIDDIYNRIGESDKKILTLNKDVMKLQELPSNGVDYLKGDVTSRFTIDGKNEIVDWDWVKYNTLHDVTKSYRWVDKESGREFFGSDGYDGFEVKGIVEQEIETVSDEEESGDVNEDENINDDVQEEENGNDNNTEQEGENDDVQEEEDDENGNDGEQDSDNNGQQQQTSNKRYALYEIITIKRQNESIRRFVPVYDNVDVGKITKEILPDASACFDDATYYVSGYDKANDRGTLTVRWSSQNVAKVKNMFLTVTKNGEKVSSADIKNLSSYTFNNLDFDTTYGFYITLNSEYNNSHNNVYNKFNTGNISVLIKPEESIEFIGEPILSDDGALYTYVTWQWILHHQGCENVKLYYRDSIGNSGEYTNVKYQSFAQPPSFQKIYTDENGVSQKNIVTYGFKIKSDYIRETNDYKKDADGYITVHENSIELI